MLIQAVAYIFDNKYGILFHKIILWNFTAMLNIFFLFVYTLKCNLFLWIKAEFSASLLQSLVSHDLQKCTFTHLADAVIQSDLQVIHLLSVCVFPGNWTHNLCAMLNHWVTGTHSNISRNYFNILIYYQCWKQLYCLLFFGTCDIYF